MAEAPSYRYVGASHNHSHAYLMPALDAALVTLEPRRIFDLGCGNGSVANLLSSSYEVMGVDPSPSGIAQAKAAYPELRLELGSAYDDLASSYGQFDVVISLEVVEHVFDPRLYAQRLFDLVRPGGAALVSTPYHGYLKNLALAVSGRMDAHFTALWDGGHIKFWSMRTLRVLLEEAGFQDLRFRRIGRVPQLAKSMMVVATRPA